MNIRDSGAYMGLASRYGNGSYVGKNSKYDGNILLIGINGSGKSQILVKSSLETWHDTAIVLDIKGELSEHMVSLERKGLITRPPFRYLGK